MNFASGWESVADAMPNTTALVQGDRRRSWAEFDDRAARLAAAFADLGLRADSKVASYLYNSNEYVEGQFATFKLRAASVNVNYRYVDDELHYLLEDSDAEVLLFHGHLAEHVDTVRGRLPQLRAVVQVDDGSPPLDGALQYEELVVAYEPAPRIERSGDELVLLYTGGTTGMPKGVMWRHADLCGTLAPTAYRMLDVDAPDDPRDAGPLAVRFEEAGLRPVHLPASPLMHGTGFMTTIVAMLVGATIVTLESRHFDPHELWETVQRERVTQIAIVGDAFGKPMVRALEEAERDSDPYDLSSLNFIASSGVIWSAPVKEALMARGGFLCLDLLGSTEGIGYANKVDAPGTRTETGRFRIGDHARVLTEDGREVEPGSGERGRLALAGHIPLGYYKDEAKTAETFPTLGGVRYSIPGDWATVESDGTITLLGRGSVSINTGGEKVYPEEVEETVKTHPAVADAVVVGIPDDRFGEAVTAVVALRRGEQAAPEDIAESTRGALAGYKRPKRVVIVDEVRRGANGKADYAWAKEQARARLG